MLTAINWVSENSTITIEPNNIFRNYSAKENTFLLFGVQPTLHKHQSSINIYTPGLMKNGRYLTIVQNQNNVSSDQQLKKIYYVLHQNCRAYSTNTLRTVA